MIESIIPIHWPVTPVTVTMISWLHISQELLLLLVLDSVLSSAAVVSHYDSGHSQQQVSENRSKSTFHFTTHHQLVQ